MGITGKLVTLSVSPQVWDWWENKPTLTGIRDEHAHFSLCVDISHTYKDAHRPHPTCWAVWKAEVVRCSDKLLTSCLLPESVVPLTVRVSESPRLTSPCPSSTVAPLSLWCFLTPLDGCIGYKTEWHHTWWSCDKSQMIPQTKEGSVSKQLQICSNKSPPC